jgi:hypothetical protein
MPAATPAPAPKVNWLALERKVRYAFGVMLGLNGATVISALNGSASWREALVAIVFTDLPVATAYLVKSEA